MRLTVLTAFLILAACEAPSPMITGGPCSYETDTITATVTETDEDGVFFEGPDGEFYISGNDLDPRPEPGDVLTLKRERITEGTCTPEIYSVIDQAD